MYVRVDGLTVAEYPYSFVQLQRDNPSVSFPIPCDDELLAEWGVYPVQTVVPDYDAITQDALEADPVWDAENEVWKQSWTISDLAASIIDSNRQAAANYVGFHRALLGSDVYATIRTQAGSSLALNVACTEFIAALTDAKYGSVETAVFQACLDQIIALATLDDDDRIAFQVLMRTFSLGTLYSVWDGDLPAASSSEGGGN